MKTKNIFLLFLAVFFFFSCGSQAKDDISSKSDSGESDTTNTDVPYKPCPCEFDEKPVTVQGEARFFIDTFYVENDNYMVWYNNRDIDNAYLMMLGTDDSYSMPIKVNICNFPDFAKKWHSENGIIVYYEGLKYPWCEHLTLCRGFCGTMILTKLKIQ